MPYSFSFCFNISHFSFWASERNNYASPLPSSLTSAVSARASVLSTMMSSFSPRSMILSMPHVASHSHTNVVDHHALHRVQLLLHTRSRVRIRIVPLRLHISHTQGHDHQLTNRRGELGHGERLSRLRAIATPHQTTEQRTRKWQKSCRPSPSGSSIPQRAERNSQTQYEAAYRGQS